MSQFNRNLVMLKVVPQLHISSLMSLSSHPTWKPKKTLMWNLVLLWSISKIALTRPTLNMEFFQRIPKETPLHMHSSISLCQSCWHNTDVSTLHHISSHLGLLNPTAANTSILMVHSDPSHLSNHNDNLSPCIVTWMLWIVSSTRSHFQDFPSILQRVFITHSF